MISPSPETVLGPGGCPAFTTWTNGRTGIRQGAESFLMLARLFDAFGGLLFLELREPILHGRREVAHVEEPADLDDHFVILLGDTRGPFYCLFARLHINYVVAADHFFRFGKRTVGNLQFPVF